MNLRITGYNEEVDRGDPEGLHITYDMDSDLPIVARTFWMGEEHSAVATPLEEIFPVKPGTDGRYYRGLNVKPTITGEHYFFIQLQDEAGDTVQARSDTPVIVTERGGNGDTDMEDRFDLVCRIRKGLWPELYQPGHPEANRDGWLRIDRVAPNQSNLHVGLDRGALWAKHIAWEIGGEAGLAHAKRGSENTGGACPEAPDGITTDIVCRSDGAHWDFQQDSAGAGYPQWNAVPQYVEEDGRQIDLWTPIKERFVYAFAPAVRRHRGWHKVAA